MAKNSKSAMQKEVDRTEAAETAKGEQMPLIEVRPENVQEMTNIAERYKAVCRKRQELTAQETSLKEKLKELIGKAKLQRLEDGSIKFNCGGYPISVTPRDEVIRIGEKKD
jgi:hypothetical protein